MRDTPPTEPGLGRDGALLVLRADANAQIGVGHVMRCLALAQEWRHQGGEAVFLGRIDSEPLRQRLANKGCLIESLPASHPDPRDLTTLLTWLKERQGQRVWLVLDGYHFDAGYHQAIRASGWPLLIIDDYAHLPRYHADILLNPNAYADELSYRTDADTLFLLGSRYALLRKEFRETHRGHEVRQSKHPHRILVTMGGADPDNVSARAMDALQAMDCTDLDVKIIIGPLNPHRLNLAAKLKQLPFPVELLPPVANMAPLMQWADLAVSAAGSTCWELATLGIPMVVTVLADNQEHLATSLATHGAAINLGWFHAWQPAQAADRIDKLLTDQARCQQMGMTGRQLIDGLGCKRVIERMLESSRR